MKPVARAKPGSVSGRPAYSKGGVPKLPDPGQRACLYKDHRIPLHNRPKDIDATTCAYEYPKAYIRGMNEPYYPIPRDDSRELYQKYAEMAKRLKNVIFAGRLADYKYYNMDQAVHRALTCFEKQIVPCVGMAA
jgi:UDP-galactopyranose mutase